MENFPDSCTVIFYLEYFIYKNELRERCARYIQANENLLCFYVLREIKEVIKKREIQFNEILKKLEDDLYDIGSSKESEILNKKEIIYTENLFEEVRNYDIEMLGRKFESEISIMRLNLRIFLKKIKEFVIKEEEIDKSLVNLLREFIEDYSDCKILASALQTQQNREIFLFLTADKHINPDGYDFIKEDPRLKNYKFPTVKNLLFENQ